MFDYFCSERRLYRLLEWNVQEHYVTICLQMAFQKEISCNSEADVTQGAEGEAAGRLNRPDFCIWEGDGVFTQRELPPVS